MLPYFGMGPGGEVGADRRLKAGMKVVSFKRELIDGECKRWPYPAVEGSGQAASMPGPKTYSATFSSGALGGPARAAG